ncbi:MAG: hypothetical protein WA947_12120 [Phormidesmis sp.]
MDSIHPIEQQLIEQQLIESIRTLAPDKQQAVLDFAEFLKNRQNPYDKILSNEQFPASEKSNEAVDKTVNLSERNINPAQAAELRSRLQSFEEDWNRPEMAIYDEI